MYFKNKTICYPIAQPFMFTESAKNERRVSLHKGVRCWIERQFPRSAQVSHPQDTMDLLPSLALETQLPQSTPCNTQCSGQTSWEQRHEKWFQVFRFSFSASQTKAVGRLCQEQFYNSKSLGGISPRSMEMKVETFWMYVNKSAHRRSRPISTTTLK